MAPYLLGGFIISGVMSVILTEEKIKRHLGGSSILSVFKASLLGVPLPLCSCSVIPVATSLRQQGAGRGATTSFLISTPQTGVDSIFVTFSLLGPVFAIFRPIVAFVSGLTGGIIVSLFDKKAVDGDNVPGGDCCKQKCCGNSVKQNTFRRIMEHGLLTLPGEIAPSLLIGLIICALVASFVPGNWFSDLVPPGPLQILVIMAAGIPVYICATASVPVAAGLILSGVSPGAAFALLITGPATNGATISVIWRIMGKYTCVIYLLTMICSAFFGGLLLDYIFFSYEVKTVVHDMWIPQWVKDISAILLVFVLLGGVLSPVWRKERANRSSSDNVDAG